MLVDEVQLDQGPVLVTVEYEIEAKDSDDSSWQRSRNSHACAGEDGAARWGVYYDTEHPTLYLETFYRRIVGGTLAATRPIDAGGPRG